MGMHASCDQVREEMGNGLVMGQDVIDFLSNSFPHAL